MKIQFLKLSLFAFLSLFIFSCEEETFENPKEDIENNEKAEEKETPNKDESEKKDTEKEEDKEKDTEDKKCPEIDLIIKKNRGLDIKIYSKQIDGATYQWTIERNGEIEENDGDSENPHFLVWGPRLGTTTFCVTIKTKECEEKYCATFVATEKQFEEANKANKTISIIKNDSGVFTYSIKDKEITDSKCLKKAKIIVNYRKVNVVDPEVIGFENRKKATYVWTVDGESTTGISDHEYLLGWSPENEITEFCVKITTPDCLEGITICEEVSFSEAEERMVISNPDIENFRFEKNEAGIFTFKFDKKVPEVLVP